MVGEQNNFGLNFLFFFFFFLKVFLFLLPCLFPLFFSFSFSPKPYFSLKYICLVIPVSLLSHFILFPSFSFPKSFGLVVTGGHIDFGLA